MNHLIAEVRCEDVAELREFMPGVIARTVTADTALLAEMRENVLGSLDWSIEHADRCCHLKATVDGRIAGVVLVKQFWNLCSLFVDPNLHRCGIGRALVEASVEICRGRSEKNAIWLNAAPDAIPFYRRLGFMPREATRPLPPGFLAMQLSLSDNRGG